MDENETYKREKYQSISNCNNVEIIDLDLETCFKNIIQGIPLELDVETLNRILKIDLLVNFNYLKTKLKTVIPFMLVHFIKGWPGWQKSSNYLNKEITFEEWFRKFREYLVFKVNYLIKNDYEKVQSKLKANLAIDESILFKIDNCTQTNVSEKPEAPYVINIEGTPKVLNSLIFCEGLKGTIMLKEYKRSPVFEKLTTKQLLNWPYVELQFWSEELSFKRSNMHEFKRYIMLSNEKITFKRMETFIEEIEIINEQINRMVYTLNTLKRYCNMYINVLRTHQSILEITDEYITDVNLILNEFVSDVEDLNMNSMATNTSALFNIGKYIYARNKSVSGHGVCFAESIIPKVKITLFSFTGLKNNKFELLENGLYSANKAFVKKLLPVLKYGCSYCSTHHNTKVDLLNHFQKQHCMENPVLCFKCKSEIDVPTISGNRWSHYCCQDNNKKQS